MAGLVLATYAVAGLGEASLLRALWPALVAVGVIVESQQFRIVAIMGGSLPRELCRRRDRRWSRLTDARFITRSSAASQDLPEDALQNHDPSTLTLSS